MGQNKNDDSKNTDSNNSKSSNSSKIELPKRPNIRVLHECDTKKAKELIEKD